MKSTAQIKGHPLHPILVAFPIAFYTGTLVFDIMALAIHPVYLSTAYYLNIAALLTAVLAAIPGVIDYIYTIPPKSSAKKRGTRHALTNTGVLVLFLAALIVRMLDESPNLILIIIIESIGTILLLAAGWMGGTLVYRNQIGVDIRYADAGKWNELRLKSVDGEIEAGLASEIGLNQMKLIHAGDRRIVVARSENGLAAFNDFCSHRGGSLAGGAMICGTVQCPWHGSQFDVHSGKVKAGPAKMPIAVYPVSERDGKIYILLS